jgi:methylmalonyl-CoA/ethylmalonyl-CoA epimerase
MLENLKFHHIGVLTNSIDNSTNRYVEFGYKSTNVIHDPIQNVNICFLSKKKHPIIELIEPVSDGSKVFSILQKNGSGPYHTCYETEDIQSTIKILKSKHFIQISNPVKAIAISNRLICFLYSKELGLIELVQS